MSQNFAELDVIKVKVAPSDNVPVGSIGTVLIAYDGLPRKYEIEFMKNGVTLDVCAVFESDLELVSRRKKGLNILTILRSLLKK